MIRVFALSLSLSFGIQSDRQFLCEIFLFAFAERLASLFTCLCRLGPSALYAHCKHIGELLSLLFTLYSLASLGAR